MTGLDYYQVLGVRRHASSAELRAAFVRLVKRHHPDLAPPGAELSQRLREVQRAYRCLTDAERRAAHDRALAEREQLHLATQYAIHRRLRRYDRRHPQRPPRRRKWRPVLLVVCIAAITSLKLLA